ncbi:MULTISPECIES: PTS mannose/fructose/sorbose/N-acetylgalactosamine transporter subunit IIC [Lactobacillus]|uniref:PTS sugar transporter subunit IIC n=1 Tax=Lactobacillus melliventris TaxID=1218507 RepID=A0ABX5N2R8_9LACO|nr:MULTISPECIES: PTS sugar transporter subunit IIC [Lactobacillus]MBC6350465.1 PTS sugar transporter subunit IIC [Lactobacillus melliventris]PXY86053.1 PTS sugar transporter subunit IIC [Lactobacillus melliventris]WLT00506.1 PTS sugar transporter subunit IIC [Lactobacillus helsingborgensis]
MNMALFWQAALVGIFGYLGAVDSIVMGGVAYGFYILGRPLIAGFICGLIFGDVKAGVLCGLAVQAVFIATMHTGGTSSTEITYASYGGIGLAMATTKDPAIAVTLAIFIGQTFGLIFYNLRMAGFSYFNHRADRDIDLFNKHALIMDQVVWPQIITFLVRAVPIWAAIYFGRGAVEALLKVIPTQITSIITVLGGLLPALGIAMLMNMLIKNKLQLIYFLFGFAMIAFAKMSTIGLVFIAVLIAYIVYQISGKTGNNNSNNSSSTEKAIQTEDEYEDADLF